MATIDVGVGHDDDLMISKLFSVKFISYAAT